MYYVVKATDNDIIHKTHKYIDRKRGKNGKWIYYYTKKPSSIKSRLGVYAKENAKEKTDKYYKEKSMNEAWADAGIKKISESIWEHDDEKFEEGLKIRNEAWAQDDKNFNDMIEAVNFYKDTPLGKLEEAGSKVKDAYDSGIYWLEKTFKRR